MLTSIKEIDANLLFFLYNQRTPSTIYPRFLKEVTFDNDAYQPESGNLKVENGLAIFSCKFSYDEPLSKLFAPDFFSQELKFAGLTDNNESFTAEYIVEARRNLSEAGLVVTFQSDRWSLGNTNPHMWVGLLSTNLPYQFGNLYLSAKIGSIVSGSNFHLFLEGSVWNYYVIRGGDKESHDLLVIDTNGNPLNYGLLNREFDMLSFCLGCPINTNFFTGVDDRGKITGYMGGRFGNYRIKKNFSDTPVPNGPSQSWGESLFKLLSGQSNKDDILSERLRETIKLYVEASAETNLPSREMKLLTACLTIARFFLDDSSYLLIDSDRWAGWMSENTNLFKSLAKDDKQDIVKFQFEELNKLGPVSVLSMALRKAKLKQEQLFLDTVKRSQDVALGIFHQEDYDMGPALARSEILRVLCVGLIAVSIDYKGPINVKSLSQYQIPTSSKFVLLLLDNWWTHDTNFTPARYIAEASELLRVPATELWPVFKRPTVPEDSLVTLIKDFANSLSSRTGGIVQARLLPLPVFADEQSRLYDFRLESKKLPQVNTVLFTVRQESQASAIEIINWDDVPESISDEQALFTFLKLVAESNKTRHAVERLLLATNNE